MWYISYAGPRLPCICVDAGGEGTKNRDQKLTTCRNREKGPAEDGRHSRSL